MQAVKEDVNFHEGQHQSQSGKLHFQNFWICVKFTPAVKEKVYSSERAVKPWDRNKNVKIEKWPALFSSFFRVFNFILRCSKYMPDMRTEEITSNKGLL